jgi:hypothetical protein
VTNLLKLFHQNHGFLGTEVSAWLFALSIPAAQFAHKRPKTHGAYRIHPIDIARLLRHYHNSFYIYEQSSNCSRLWFGTTKNAHATDNFVPECRIKRIRGHRLL